MKLTKTGKLIIDRAKKFWELSLKYLSKYMMPIFTILLAAGLATAFSFFSWEDFYKYLFSGFATLISAWAVLAVYYVQKRDTKIKSAQILLMEVRAAERALDELKKGGFDFEVISVLPANNWSDAQHLFIKDLDEDEFNLINNFYHMCEIIDKNVEFHKDYKTVSFDEKARTIQNKLMELADKHQAVGMTGKDYVEERNRILGTFAPEPFLFEVDAPKFLIQRFLPQIRYVTSSTAGEKLKRLAKG